MTSSGNLRERDFAGVGLGQEEYAIEWLRICFADRVFDGVDMLDKGILKSPRSRFRAAMALAIVADAVQILIFPLFAEGAISPLDDVLDFAVMLALIQLVGWHWEFLPSFVGEVVPGLDLVPFWTFAIINVYRKWKPVPAEDTVRVIDVEPTNRKPSNR